MNFVDPYDFTSLSLWTMIVFLTSKTVEVGWRGMFDYLSGSIQIYKGALDFNDDFDFRFIETRTYI